jgi:hypothetical protein
VLNEFYMWRFAAKIYAGIEECRSTSTSGCASTRNCWCYGKMRLQTFVDSVSLVKRKDARADDGIRGGREFRIMKDCAALQSARRRPNQLPPRSAGGSQGRRELARIARERKGRGKAVVTENLVRNDMRPADCRS